MKNLSSKKYTEPLAIVLFGGTGDLARAKLLPALVDLYIAHGLPDTFMVVGLSRKDMTDEAYREFVQSTVAITATRAEKDIHNFCKHVHYLSGNFDERLTYDRIVETLQAFDVKIGRSASRMLYLAVPPDFYSHIFNFLKESGIMSPSTDSSWSRLLIEKPFGRDLQSATLLDAQVRSLFANEQIYCVDHYLEKEAIENILSIRFENSLFADIWDRRHIESMHVRVLEKTDVSVRGAFYDKTGALRDVGQNHILETLSLLIMDRPHKRDAKTIHVLRSEAMNYFSDSVPRTIIRGQYKGYIGTPGVGLHSQTETYFKIETKPDADVWGGVSFIIESGKALHENVADAVVIFQEGNDGHKNTLRIGFSPKPYIIYTTWNKKNGSEDEYEKHETDLSMVNPTDMPDGYERVLFDCMTGDQTRFVSSQEIIAAWKFITPILESFGKAPLQIYEPGQSGPVVDAI